MTAKSVAKVSDQYYGLNDWFWGVQQGWVGQGTHPCSREGATGG